MNIQQKGIIKIIQAALTQSKQELPEGFNFEEAVLVGKRHQIASLLYYGAMNCGIPQGNPLMQELFNYTCKGILVSEQQLYAINKIFSSFDEKHIEYMPLKGTLLKKMYPKHEMRLMGDADILIKTEQYEDIKAVMQELGYKEHIESDHEFIWSKQNVCIELHKRLIPSYNKDYYEYYGDGWKLAKLNDNGTTRYKMTSEDEMIYLFTHFAKHYRSAGIGIRHIIDLWVYRLNNSELDEIYIEKELKKLKLYDFYINIINTLEVWFGNFQEDAKTDLITTHIFNSGVYGTHEATVLSDAYRDSKSVGSANNVRIKKFLNLVFLPYKFMAEKYTILKKIPILLPLMWVIRAINVVLFKKKTIQSKVNDFETANTQKVNDFGQALNFVGLDFNFEE